MQFAASTPAVGLAALALVGVQGPGQARLSPEAVLEQTAKRLLGLGELGAELTELLVHRMGPVQSVYYYIIIPTDTRRVSRIVKKN